MNETLQQILDKANADKSLDEILKMSPAALKGVSDGDAELLQKAFGIKTIAEMARNKYFLRAQALVALSESK
jgi:hypothetical protein